LTWPGADRTVVSWIWTICCPAAYLSPCALVSSLSITVVMKPPTRVDQIASGHSQALAEGAICPTSNPASIDCEGASVGAWLGKILTIGEDNFADIHCVVNPHWTKFCCSDQRAGLSRTDVPQV
jgi:hypothetical protein